MLLSFQLLHIALIAFGILMLSKIALGKNLPKDENQYVVFLIIALGLWIAMDIQRMIFYHISDLSEQQQFQKSLFINIFSAWNNAFLLATMPLYAASSKVDFLKSDNWIKYLLGANLIVTISYIFLWSLENEWGSQVIRIFNEVYSIATLTVIAYLFFRKLRSHPLFGNTVSMVWAMLLLTLFFLPISYRFIEGAIPLPAHYASIYSVHLVVAFTGLLLVFERIKAHQIQLLLNKSNALQDKVRYADEAIEALKQLEHKGLANHDGLKRHLKFFKENGHYVIELTMLDLDIVRLKIMKPQLNREYKDLLRFAVYKKAGLILKSYGGMLKGFGEVSKSILDIRKRLINPMLIEKGFNELNHNELIVQRIKGSGVYELECHPDQIFIEVEQLSKNHELAEILEPLAALQKV